VKDNRRYYGLDALRGAMMLLGIVLHAGGFYISSPPPQLAGMPNDHNTSYLFDLVFHFIHSFRMPLFFVLAGFFAALLVDKRGLWGTYKDRAARIFAPLVAATFTILPFTILFMLDFLVAVRFGVMEIVPDRARVNQVGRELKAAGFPADQLSVGHLWFLLYLCYFYLLMPICRLLVSALEPLSAKVGALLTSPFALAFFGLFTAATLWPFHGGQVHEGFIFLTPHVPSIAYYGSFFAFGYVFHRYRGVLDAFARMAPACTWLAAILFPLSLWASHLDNTGVGDITGHHLAAVVAHGLCTWALIYAFTGWMLRLFDRESPWILYISQSAYWVYLVHMVFVTLAGWLLAPFDLPAVAKFAIVASFTTVGCFATYHYLVQRTWVSRFLHGKRFDLDWPWRARPAAAIAA
jgi:glucan biosynthesis protein C